MYLYLAVSLDVISVALVREAEKVQWFVYYVTKRLLDAETRYGELEKLAYALVMASLKMQPYFMLGIMPIKISFIFIIFCH